MMTIFPLLGRYVFYRSFEIEIDVSVRMKPMRTQFDVNHYNLKIVDFYQIVWLFTCFPLLQVEKRAKDFDHYSVSQNTQDSVLADPLQPTLQESRTALENYSYRRRDIDEGKQTITRIDYGPVSSALL